MDTNVATRRSRWADPLPVKVFVESDLEICKLLTPALHVREPWGYGHLPSSYFSPLLGRGKKGILRRVRDLRGSPSYLELSEQPQNNYRDLIYRLSRAGQDEVIAAGGNPLKIKRPSHPVPHELLACIIAASFEMGSREISAPISLHPKMNLPVIPDWPIFDFMGRTVFIEADTGSMKINPRMESEGANIRLKLTHYLQLIHEGKLDKNTLILFVTTNEHRCGSFVDVLKFTIDKLDYPHEYADCFAFNWLVYNRYLDTIPSLSAWAVTKPHQRAGHKPFTFTDRII